MLPLYRQPHFTFHFAEDRTIPRFHLDGIEAGQRVSVFRIESESGKPLELLASEVVGDGGWVDLTPPIIVRSGDTFIALLDGDNNEKPLGSLEPRVP